MDHLETLTWVLGHTQRDAAKQSREDTRVSCKELEECLEGVIGLIAVWRK